FVVSDSNNSSVPFKAPKVFDVFNMPANTAVKTTPVSQVSEPKGKNEKGAASPDVLDSTPKITVYNIQPKIIPINKAKLLILAGDFILITITSKTMKIAKTDTGTSIVASSAPLPKGIPNIPFKKICINVRPNKNINTPITPGVKNFEIVGPNPVTPISIVIPPAMITPNARLPPRTSIGIP